MIFAKRDDGTINSKYFQISDCCQYTVCWVSGKYEAFYLRENLAVNRETAEEAREACRRHKAARAAREVEMY